MRPDSGDDRALVDLASSLTHWCLIAVPDVYPVERALQDGPTIMWWAVGRLRRVLPEPGDPVLVWRTLGPGHGHRGLVARGEVVSGIEHTKDEDPLWGDAARGEVVEPRVKVWLWRLQQPLWLEDAPEVLNALKGPGQPGMADAARGS